VDFASMRMAQLSQSQSLPVGHVYASVSILWGDPVGEIVASGSLFSRGDARVSVLWGCTLRRIWLRR
jgi:hypothetical protein